MLLGVLIDCTGLATKIKFTDYSSLFSGFESCLEVPERQLSVWKPSSLPGDFQRKRSGKANEQFNFIASAACGQLIRGNIVFLGEIDSESGVAKSLDDYQIFFLMNFGIEI